MTESLPSWVRAWRDAIAPALDVAELEALATGLRDDDPRIEAGQTVQPVPVGPDRMAPPVSACPLGYALWAGGDLRTAAEVEEAVGELATVIGDAQALRLVMAEIDGWTRAEVRAHLLPEVERELARRKEIVTR